MNEKKKTSGSIKLTKGLLRSFAKGELDLALESKIIALLAKKPKLKSQVEAISTEAVLSKLRSAGTVENAGSSSLLESGSEAASPSSDSATQDILSELKEYRIVREIGRGGMGVIYLAENQWMGNRKEVLKVLNESMYGNEDAKARFQREVECTAALDHPNIVRSYSVRPLNDSIVFAMEYVEGRTLHQVINDKGRLSVKSTIEIAKQICAGLQHAHSKDLIHRDIKPANIMLAKEGGQLCVKILDFGLARLSESDESSGLTQDGTLLGTLEYISPEQSLNANDADIRSDLYSLGCTFFHMLVGKPPFSGTAGELILAHSQKTAPRIDSVRNEIPTQIADVVEKMLAKSPVDRFQSPEVIAKVLLNLSTLPAEHSAHVNIPVIVENNSGESEKASHTDATKTPTVGGEKLAAFKALVSKTIAEGRKISKNTFIVAACLASIFLFMMTISFVLLFQPEPKTGRPLQPPAKSVKTGYVHLMNLPNNAKLSVDGVEKEPKVLDAKSNYWVSLPEGMHNFRITASGRTISKRLNVSAREVGKISCDSLSRMSLNKIDAPKSNHSRKLS